MLYVYSIVCTIRGDSQRSPYELSVQRYGFFTEYATAWVDSGRIDIGEREGKKGNGTADGQGIQTAKRRSWFGSGSGNGTIFETTG